MLTFFPIIILFSCVVSSFCSPVFASNEFSWNSLDAYLKDHGFYLNPVHNRHNEGYISDTQADEFREVLSTYPAIKSIAEIGLNGGHSAEVFFQECQELENFVSFDINKHPYTPFAALYFYQKDKERFRFIEGDSLTTVPRFAANNPNQKFDLIYIDGGHLFDTVIGDIMNARELAHPGTFVWIDDVPPDFSLNTGEAVKSCIEGGILKVIQSHSTVHPKHGKRYWIEAQFILFSKE